MGCCRLTFMVIRQADSYIRVFMCRNGQSRFASDILRVSSMHLFSPYSRAREP